MANVVPGDPDDDMITVSRAELASALIDCYEKGFVFGRHTMKPKLYRVPEKDQPADVRERSTREISEIADRFDILLTTVEH